MNVLGTLRSTTSCSTKTSFNQKNSSCKTKRMNSFYSQCILNAVIVVHKSQLDHFHVFSLTFQRPLSDNPAFSTVAVAIRVHLHDAIVVQDCISSWRTHCRLKGSVLAFDSLTKVAKRREHSTELIGCIRTINHIQSHLVNRLIST